MVAAKGGHTTVVKELLTRQDININMKDKVRSVSLHTIQSAKGNEKHFKSAYSQLLGGCYDYNNTINLL